MEEWKDIEGYEGLYQVSSLGRIKSLNHYASNGVTTVLYKGKVLSQTTHNGYMIAHLSKNNVIKTVSVHRLVAEAFVKNPLNKSHVNHKDGNKSNNIASNLEWCTPRENLVHALETGLRKRKVTKDKYKYFYDEHEKGKTYKELAKEFNISKTRAFEIVRDYRNGKVRKMDN